MNDSLFLMQIIFNNKNVESPNIGKSGIKVSEFPRNEGHLRAMIQVQLPFMLFGCHSGREQTSLFGFNQQGNNYLPAKEELIWRSKYYM